jgi:hypothetical protein
MNICCEVSYRHGRCNCLHCGVALPIGRVPTKDEQYFTSDEFAMGRLRAIEEAREYNDHRHEIVLAAIDRLQHLAEFTWDDLVGPTGLPASCLKHKLVCLEKNKVIKQVGLVQIYGRNRYRPVYQRLLPLNIPIPDSAPKETLPDRQRQLSGRHQLPQ